MWALMCIVMYALELEVDVWTYMYIGMLAWELAIDVWAHMCIVMYAWELEVDVWAHMCIGMHAWDLAVDVKNQFYYSSTLFREDEPLVQAQKLPMWDMAGLTSQFPQKIPSSVFLG